MAYGNIAHSPQRCSVLVGPDLRAGRFLGCTVTSSGGSEIRPYHIPCTYALAKHTRNGISQQALASLMLVLALRLVFILLDCPKNLVLWSVLVVGDWRHVIRQR